MVFFHDWGCNCSVAPLATGLHYTHVLLEGPRSSAGFIIIFPWSNDSFFLPNRRRMHRFWLAISFLIHSGVSLPKHLNHMLSGI